MEDSAGKNGVGVHKGYGHERIELAFSKNEIKMSILIKGFFKIYFKISVSLFILGFCSFTRAISKYLRTIS